MSLEVFGSKLRNTWTGCAAGLALGGLVATTPLTGNFTDQAHAQDTVALTSPQGKSVTLRIATDFSDMSGVESVERVLEARNCKTTRTDIDAVPGFVIVEVGGNTFPFTNIESAGAMAAEWCLSDQEPS